MNINYSIIIPHKNIPELLQRCLDSIPVRDDVQVIVVDDNSDKVNFAKFPQWKGQHYEVYLTKEGRGAGFVRNVGLDYAKGKWLLFADADDFFNYCLNSILDEYINDDSDLVFFAESSVDGETYVNTSRADYINELIEDYKNDTSLGTNLLRYVNDVPHGKLFKRSFIVRNNIQFQETQVDNDVKFSYVSGYYAKRIKVDKRAVYCMTYRSSSTTYTMTDVKIMDKMRVHAEKDIFFAEHHIKLPERFNHSYLGRLTDLVQQGNMELYNKCLKIISEYGIDSMIVDTMVRDKLYYKQKEKDNLDFYIHSANELLTGRRMFGQPLRIVIRMLLKIKRFWQ